MAAYIGEKKKKNQQKCIHIQSKEEIAIKKKSKKTVKKKPNILFTDDPLIFNFI